MRIPNDCFHFGRIGMKPKRGVFVEAPGDAGEKVPGEKNAPTETLEWKQKQVLEAKTKLTTQLASTTVLVQKEAASTNPNKKKAADMALDELNKIQDSLKPGRSLDYRQIQDNLEKISAIPKYMEESAAYEKTLDENRKLKDKKVKPLLASIEEYFTNYANDPKYAKLSDAGKAEIAKMKDEAMAGANIAIDGILKAISKGQPSLDEYSKNLSFFTDGTTQLKAEKALLDNPKSTLYPAVQAEIDKSESMEHNLVAVCYSDIAKNEQNTTNLVDAIYKSIDKQVDSIATENMVGTKAEVRTKLFQICGKATGLLKALPGQPNAGKRALVLAQMRDELIDTYVKAQKDAVNPNKENASVLAVVKRTGLPAGAMEDLAKQTGIEKNVLENAAKEAPAPASTPPPVSDAAPVKPPSTEAAPAQPLQSGMAVNPEILKRVQRLDNPALAQMVVSAPGEYQDALARIADRGEKQGEMINFKLLFNKTYFDYFFVKEGANKYVIKTLDPKTRVVSNSLTYTSRNEAMRELKDGIILQRAAFYALSHPDSYKEYEKMKMIDMKGKLPGAGEVRKSTDPAPDPNKEIKFQLDWEGFSDVSGNPIVTAKAKPFGAIEFTVNRAGVGLDGGNVRTGLASSMDDFFRQLQHLEKWAEDYKPGREKSPAAAKEWNYALLNNPANFFAHQERIGRPVYFGINPKTGNTDMSLDWGGGGTTELDQNPYVRMRLEPNGMIGCQAEYKGKKIDFLVANVPQIIDKLVQVRQEMTGELPRVAGSWTDQRLLTHRENPFALPPENAAQPAVAVAQNAVAAQGAVPGAVAAAPAVASTAPVVRDMQKAAQTAPAVGQRVPIVAAPAAAPAAGNAPGVAPGVTPSVAPRTAKEANDAKYQKYAVAVKAVSDYMNDTGIKYLKEYIGKGNINTMASFDAALTQLVNTVANTTSFDKPAADVSVEYPITINNVPCKIRFTPNGPNGQVVLFLTPKVKQNLAKQIIYSGDDKIQNSPLAQALDIDLKSTQERIVQRKATEKRVDSQVTAAFVDVLNIGMARYWEGYKKVHGNNAVPLRHQDTEAIKTYIGTLMSQRISADKIDVSQTSTTYFTGWYEFKPDSRAPIAYFSMIFKNEKPQVMHSDHI